MEAIDHLDLVVSSLERSLDFYRGLLRPLGYVREGEIAGERAAWLRDRGATIESGPREYDYTPGYYAVFFYDPDEIKLEILHRPRERDLVRAVDELAERVARLESAR